MADGKEEQQPTTSDIITAMTMTHHFEICREQVKVFFSEPWKCIPDSHILVSQVCGGLSNHLYLVQIDPVFLSSNSSRTTTTSSFPYVNKCLVRIYGTSKTHSPNGYSPIFSNMTENILCVILCERKLGPEIFGVFSGGRIEQYFENSQSLTRAQLGIKEISGRIAKKLAKFHSLQNLPFAKSRNWMFVVMQNWLQLLSFKKIPLNAKDESLGFWNFDLLFLDVELAKKISDDAGVEMRRDGQDDPRKHEIVFCHNDLQEGNILMEVKASSSKDFILRFIDIEYAAYNFRGYDIANHFCEWTFDYTFPRWPFFSVHLDQYPSVSQQRHFIHTYVRERRRNLRQPSPIPKNHNGVQQLQKKESTITNQLPCDVNGEDHEDDFENEVADLLKEVNVFNAHCHLFWTVWSLFNYDSSDILNFGYLEFAEIRHNLFNQKIKEILDNNNGKSEENFEKKKQCHGTASPDHNACHHFLMKDFCAKI